MGLDRKSPRNQAEALNSSRRLHRKPGSHDLRTCRRGAIAAALFGTFTARANGHNSRRGQFGNPASDYKGKPSGARCGFLFPAQFLFLLVLSHHCHFLELHLLPQIQPPKNSNSMASKGAWTRSKMKAEMLLPYISQGVIPEAKNNRWRIPGSEESPAPRRGEFVVFFLS